MGNVWANISWGLTGLMFALRVSARMKTEFKAWKKTAEDKESPGGKDITAEEIAEAALTFSEILQESITESLPFAATVQVLIVPMEEG